MSEHAHSSVLQVITWETTPCRASTPTLTLCQNTHTHTLCFRLSPGSVRTHTHFVFQVITWLCQNTHTLCVSGYHLALSEHTHTHTLCFRLSHGSVKHTHTLCFRLSPGSVRTHTHFVFQVITWLCQNTHTLCVSGHHLALSENTHTHTLCFRLSHGSVRTHTHFVFQVITWLCQNTRALCCRLSPGRQRHVGQAHRP